MKLQNKIAIVTGAAGGIGFATAKKFLQEGATVNICDINEGRINSAKGELSSLGNVYAYTVDVTDKNQIKTMIDSIVERSGRIDILINNAGITDDAQFYKMTEEQFERVIDINLKGTYLFSKAVIPTMMKNNYGKIVHAASTSGFNGNYGQSNYAASKAGIMGMTRVMAKELGKYGIYVNAVAPGFIRTEMTNKIPADVMEQKIAQIPLKKVGLPDDIANIYAFLASDEAGYITGTTIIADGGKN